MAVTDFKLIDNDLSFFNGDFAITSPSDTEADEQSIADILVYNKGELKQYPFVGVGIDLSVNSPAPEFLAQRVEITKQLEDMDGFTILELGGELINSDGTININAVRNG